MSLSRKKDVWPSVPALFGNVWAGDPLRAMEELLGRDAQVARHARAPHAFMPSVEVKENSEGYVVKADLPGIKLDDVKVTLTGNVLRIEGHRAEEAVEDKDRFHVTERTYGAFARSFALPEGTDSESVVATMKEGVLSVTIPKRPEEKPRQIRINTAPKSEQS